MIKIHYKYGLLLTCVVFFSTVYSQETQFNAGWKLTTHFGAILPHRQVVNEIIEGHTFATELSYYHSTSGNKQWQQLYAHPKIGISALYHYLGNPNELGNAYGIFPFVELPLNQRKINWRLKLGYGLGYIQKPFDVKDNFKNVAIGSHFNALIYANMLWDIELVKRFNLSSGLSIIHYSNASYAQPNLGINIFSLNFGASYNFGKSFEKIVTEITPIDKKWNKYIMTGFGIKETLPVKGPKYFVNSYSFNIIKKYSNKNSYGFGVDLFYNSSLNNLIAKDSSLSSNSLDNFRSGLVGIYTFDFGNISFLVEGGVYLFSKYKGNGWVYNRFTTRYLISEKLFFTLGLKTHIVVADFFEAGIGIKW